MWRLRARECVEVEFVRQDDAMKKTAASMQLTRAADYGVRVMIQLVALADNGRISLPELARATGAPQSFLSKVLQALTRAGFISSRRGQAGGFHVAQRGATASMLNVVEAIDGPVCLNVCLGPGRSCGHKARCPAHPVWIEAQQAMLNVLAGTSIVSLANSNPYPIQAATQTAAR